MFIDYFLYRLKDCHVRLCVEKRHTNAECVSLLLFLLLLRISFDQNHCHTFFFLRG